MLSPKLLDELRAHWHRLRPKPRLWLFPGNRNSSGDQPVDTKTVWRACHKAAQRAGLKKKVHPHALRHYAEFRTMPGKLDRSAKMTP